MVSRLSNQAQATSDDALIVLQVLAGLQPPQYRSADVNLDSQVTIADAVRLRAEIAGFLDPLPMPAQ